jgi:nucleotide-binding universal stress UspA family protein
LARLQSKAARDEANASLWVAADQLRGHGLDTAALVEMGDPADVILSQATTLDVDLLIMSTRTQSASERLLLGSIADRVIQQAHVPILVVPPDVSVWRAS